MENKNITTDNFVREARNLYQEGLGVAIFFETKYLYSVILEV